VPPGRSFDAVVGTLESSEFLAQSRTIVAAWRQGGVATRYAESAGDNHYTIVDHLADPDSAITARLCQLAFAAGA
jgi:arylformamidase